MQTCSNCLLSDNIPSVKITGTGLCNYCEVFSKTPTSSKTSDADFSELLEKFKDRSYQVIMAFSGGKDSTYTLKMLREKYKASILAVTLNNGFISEPCLKNINVVTDYLGVDSMIIKYPVGKLVKAFQYVEAGNVFSRTTLERASSICNLCIMLVKNRIYYEAMIRDIPIICFGWTPGQIETAKPLLKLNHRTVSKVFESVRKNIVGELGSEYAKYFINSEFMEKREDRVPYLYYPFVSNSYDEKEILEDITRIGWKFPDNTDGNSSNCLLNSYANKSHMDRFGYHPYAFEISNMVREGYMSREEGAEKLKNVKNDSTYDFVEKIFQDYK